MKTKFFFTTIIVTLLAMTLAACGAGATPTASQSDPAAVITAINEKMNAGDVDGVMALIADNAVFHNAPPRGATLDTRDEIRNWIQRQVDTKTMAELSDLKVDGNSVSWSVKVSRNGSPFGSGMTVAVVEDGKVISWTFK